MDSSKKKVIGLDYALGIPAQRRISDRAWRYVILVIAACAINVLSSFIWIYRVNEPFYNWGSRRDEEVYFVGTSIVLLSWLALAFVTIRWVVRRKINPQCLYLFLLCIPSGWMLADSWAVYLADNGIRVPWR